MDQINNAMQMVNQLRAMSSDPMTALKMAAQNNPQMKMILDLIQSSGGNLQSVAEQVLRFKGVDVSKLRSAFSSK